MLTETLLKIPFSLIGRVLYCRPLIGCREINLSLVASSMILQNNNGFLYAFAYKQEFPHGPIYT